MIKVDGDVDTRVGEVFWMRVDESEFFEESLNFFGTIEEDDLVRSTAEVMCTLVKLDCDGKTNEGGAESVVMQPEELRFDGSGNGEEIWRLCNCFSKTGVDVSDFDNEGFDEILVVIDVEQLL